MLRRVRTDQGVVAVRRPRAWGEAGSTTRHVDPRLRPFGQALADALAARRWTQRELAEALGITQSAVSAWKYGHAEPAPLMVFRIEGALGVEPGSLSMNLGFVPVEADLAHSFDVAVANDPRLDDRSRRVLMAAYRELVRS